ncbi:MAG: transglycosylase SLT domain-containing protein [Cyanobacteriota bacterium]
MKHITNNNIIINNQNTINNGVNTNYQSYHLLNQPIGDTLSLSTNNNESMTQMQMMYLQMQIMLLRLLLMFNLVDIFDDGQLNGSVFQNARFKMPSIGGMNFLNPACNNSTGSACNVPDTCKSYPEGTLKNIIVEEANKRGIPPAIALGMFEKESGFKVNAVGDGGNAVGLGQLHEAAAREGGICPSERTDPVKNIQASLNYLKQRHDETGNWQEALGAYNQGPGGIISGSTRQRGLAYANDVINRANNYA